MNRNERLVKFIGNVIRYNILGVIYMRASVMDALFCVYKRKDKR